MVSILKNMPRAFGKRFCSVAAAALTQEAKIKVSTLSNGLKVTTTDRAGLISHLGLFVKAGTKYETSGNLGVTNMMEMMAFRSIGEMSHLDILRKLEKLGGKAGCQGGKEHIMYHAEVIREHAPEMIPLIAGNILNPRFDADEIAASGQEIEIKRFMLENNNDELISELLHQAAYPTCSMGNPMLMSPSALETFTPDIMNNYMKQLYIPNRSVFVGVNIEHDELCEQLESTFLPMRQGGDVPEPPVSYQGGALMSEADSELTSMAIGFGTEGWNSEDLVPVTVLQILLGGGGAFSTGGPGKGMHSRLFTQVMARYPQLETCMAFNTMNTNTGLFGIYMVGRPEHVPTLVQIAADQFSRLDRFTEEEVSRAKNQLKASVYMNVETSRVLMEDLGRQLLMSGYIRDSSDFASAIDRVTGEDLVRVAAKLQSTPPTYVVRGHTAYAPTYEQVKLVLTARTK